MAHTDLSHTEGTPKPEGVQEGKSLQVNIRDPAAKREVREALKEFGFSRIGTGVRVILLAFARSAAVRDAVRESLPLATLTPVEDR